MSTFRLISPRVNLIDEVLRSLRPNDHDYSSNLVVFPGKRPAHVLRKKLADQLKTAFLPPKVFSIDVFIDHLYTEHFGRTERTIDTLDAAAILYSLHSALSQDKKISDKHFTTLDSFYPLAKSLFSELEELYIAGIDQRRLQEVTANVSLPSTGTLIELYSHFYSELAKQKLTTRSMKYRFVAGHRDEIDFSKYSKMIFAGFYAFTAAEEIIFKKIVERPNCELIFHDGADIKVQLAKIGITAESEIEHDKPTYHFYQSPDAHGQFFSLNSVLKEQLPEMVKASDDSVIVLPSSENLFPLYHQTLAQYDRDSYNIALGYPLDRTPVYGFLMALMDVLLSSRNGTVFVPTYLQFMLHPYTKNILWKNRSDVTRMIVQAIERYCTTHNTKTYISLDEIERSPEIIDPVQRRMKGDETELTDVEIQAHIRYMHDNTVQKFLSFENVGGLGRQSVDVLQFIFEHSTAHRHPFFRPFVETLLQHLEALQHSMLANEQFTKPEFYYSFLKQYISDAEVPFTGTPLQGLQVLGFLETRGLKFKNVYIVDLNDDVLPGGIQQDVLLPLKMRQQLGLSTYKDQERIKSHIFETLCDGAENVHCFFIENDSKIKSRFIEKLLWDEQKTKHSLDAGKIQQLQYAIDLGIHQPDAVKKTPAMIEAIKEMQFSSTSLDTYLTCQLQFYYRYVLRLHERSDISGDVERADIGTIIHEILNEYFLSLKGKPITTADLQKEKLQRLTEDAFARYYGKNLLGEQFIAKRQVIKHLEEFFDNYQATILKEQSVTIESLEQELSANIDDRLFKGFADRIEKRGDDVYILDYKTGANEKSVAISLKKLDPDDRETWKEAIGSVQLPLYMMMYSRSADIPASEIIPAILFLGKKQLDAKSEMRLFESKEEAAEWYPKLEKVVLSLVDEIKDVRTPFEPTDDIVNDCPDCPFKFICGTQWAEKFSFY
ncbi:MAG: PD-(D/E)XK nuclease family protein [Ignavibacteriales bacterium]|nr:PD-(D/E)XK nuclease family protein [Ignavibacteriales bacterium]